MQQATMKVGTNGKRQIKNENIQEKQVILQRRDNLLFL